MYLQIKKSSLNDAIHWCPATYHPLRVTATLTIRVMTAEVLRVTSTVTAVVSTCPLQQNRGRGGTMSTELEEMEDFFCSPNSIARESPRNKEKNEPTSFTDMNDFLTWIQRDRPLQAGTMCTYMDHLCSGLQFACSCTSCRHYTSKGWRCLVLSRNELLRQTR